MAVPGAARRVDRLSGGAVAELVGRVAAGEVEDCLRMLTVTVIDVVDLGGESVVHDVLTQWREQGRVSPATRSQLAAVMTRHEVDAAFAHRSSDIDASGSRSSKRVLCSVFRSRSTRRSDPPNGSAKPLTRRLRRWVGRLGWWPCSSSSRGDHPRPARSRQAVAVFHRAIPFAVQAVAFGGVHRRIPPGVFVPVLPDLVLAVPVSDSQAGRVGRTEAWSR